MTTVAGTPLQVTGTLVFDYGLPASALTVRVYDVGFAGQDVKLGETTTDAAGTYTITYQLPAGSSPNLQVRALDAAGNELPLSTTTFQAQPVQVLNLVVQGSVRPLTPEFQRLSTDVTATAGSFAGLAQAQESTTRPDISLLAQTTGWDARVLALASTSATLSTTVGLGQDVTYALVRAGLPSDPQKLALVDPAAVTKALGKANASGIVSLTDSQIAQATTAFTSFARTTRLTMTASGAASSFGDLLSRSGLTADQQTGFADLVFSQPAASDGLWEQAAALGIAPAALDALQLQGKLAYLTFNNGPLAQKLQQDLGSQAALPQLADKDLHTNDAWKSYLDGLAGTDPKALDALIPPAYTGPTTADRLESYAADLARKVRMSFPTEVAARVVEKAALPVGPAAATQVSGVLRNAAGLGYELGRTPLNAFLAANQATLFAGLSPADATTVAEGVKTVHRLSQITPSDESLTAALTLGITSAHDIAAFSAEEFLDRVGSAFPSLDEAGLVYRRAQQVTATTLALAALAKQLDVSPPMYALSPAGDGRQSAKDSLIHQFPSLESLMGSLDYCQCDDCRSVLSPAAYLVDLLRFLDPPDTYWNAFLSQWKGEHHQQNYTDTYAKPYDALVERRPDLPNIELTCDNTNTVVPYIDLVNEILEYFVVKGGLDAGAAYDTGEAASADLVAEPQNILPAAYNTLATATYPLGLPFDLWIETVRGFLAYFGTPLWRLLEVFRPAEALELFTDANGYPYYLAEIVAEYLGLSPSEYAALTAVDPLSGWFKLYGYADEPTALSELASAKTLALRLGVGYQDLVDLLKTGFVNPHLDVLGVLGKAGLQPEDVLSYEGQAGHPPMDATQKAAFEAALDGLSARFNPAAAANGFNARTWLAGAWTGGSLNQILVLADSSPGCDFEATRIQFANGTAATAPSLLRLNHIVRLWKKLEWSIPELDGALRTFVNPLLPADTDANFSHAYGAALRTAVVDLGHLARLSDLLGPGAPGRIGLLPLWSNLPDDGPASLYAQLFLSPSTIAADPVFDDPGGNYLSTPGLIKDHLVALQGALGLTADDVTVVLADAARFPAHAGLTMDNAALTLGNVSMLYAYATLAKALHLSVVELVELEQMSGLNPFTPPTTTPLALAADDVIATQTLGLVDAAAHVAASGFSIEDLRYLLRHNFDPAGRYRQNPDSLMQLYRSIADAISQIEGANSQPADALSFTDAVIRQKLALAFPSDVVQTFMGMWTGTIQYLAVQAGVAPAQHIDPATLAQFPGIAVTYDPVTQVQTLTAIGVLLDPARTAIQTANASPVLAGLLGSVQDQAKAFFQKYLQVASIGQQAIGFLPAGDFDLLFALPPPGATDAVLQAQAAAKRTELAATFLPYLRQKLIKSTVVQALADNLSADASLIENLISNQPLLADPSQPAGDLLEAFVGAGRAGLTATYGGPTLVGSPAATVATADTADPGLPMPAGATSAAFGGYLLVPADGPYRFFVELGKQNMEARLQFDVQSDPLLLSVAATDNAEASQVIDLKAGIPYRFRLDLSALAGGAASLLVQGESVARGPLGRLNLYPQAAVDRLTRAQVLLSKVVQLVTGLGLTQREIGYLVAHAADFGNLNLGALPAQAADDSLGAAATLFGQFLRLAAYAALRQEMAGGTDGLIDVFERSHRTFLAGVDPAQSIQSALQDLYQQVADLTRRTPAAVQAAATQLGMTATAQAAGGQLVVTAPGFSQERSLGRLWDAMKLIQTIGIPASVLAGTTAIVDPTKSPDARAATAASLRNAVKSHYDTRRWRPIAQSIFDPLRQAKRDALALFLIDKLGLSDTNQLFEHFLVDPGMEPVVKTSRIRLALSSVQTFVQRCLLNIEPKVDPSAIPAAQWEWMKRYRVWEANREIFLWPENWMEPEWRLDKTDLFRALESTLFQGDVTNDLAETALLTYLRDLEGRARLDIVTMYREQVDNDPAAATLHVIGRNHGKPRKYFYRCFAFGAWEAWEPVKVDIESDHLAVVVWRDRPHLFWVTFVPASSAGSPPSPGGDSSSKLSDVPLSHFTQALAGGSPQHQQRLILHWAEYLKGKWSETRSSDPNRVAPVDVPDDFDPRSVYVSVDKETDAAGNEGAVKVILSSPISSSFRLAGRNAEPELVSEWFFTTSGQLYDYSFAGAGTDATKVTGSGPLQVRFASKVVNPDTQDTETISTETILQQGNRFALLYCDAPVMPLADQWNHWPTAESKMLAMPFFYQDIDNDVTLFVQPALTETRITKWPHWGIRLEVADPVLATDAWWSSVPLVAQVPSIGQPIQLDPSSLVAVAPRVDWATHPATAVQFGTVLIGRQGGLAVNQLNPGVISRLPGIVQLGGTRGATTQVGITQVGTTSIGTVTGINRIGLLTGAVGAMGAAPAPAPVTRVVPTPLLTTVTGTTIAPVGPAGLTPQHVAVTQLPPAAQAIQAAGTKIGGGP